MHVVNPMKFQLETAEIPSLTKFGMVYPCLSLLLSYLTTWLSSYPLGHWICTAMLLLQALQRLTREPRAIFASTNGRKFTISQPLILCLYTWCPDEHQQKLEVALFIPMRTFNHYTLIWYIDIIIKTFNIYILFREIAEAALVIWLAVLVSYMHILKNYIYI